MNSGNLAFKIFECCSYVYSIFRFCDLNTSRCFKPLQFAILAKQGFPNVLVIILCIVQNFSLRV